MNSPGSARRIDRLPGRIVLCALACQYLWLTCGIAGAGTLAGFFLLSELLLIALAIFIHLSGKDADPPNPPVRNPYT